MPNLTNININIDISTLPVVTAAGLSAEATEGNDNLSGSAGADEIHGLGGRDFIGGLGGDDLLDGGAGDDVLTGGAGADTLIGGSGFDTASYSTAGLGVTVDLTSGGATNDAVGDTFDSIEEFVGSNFGDIFNGDAGANNFDGGAGDDWLFGQGGDDKLVGGPGDDHLRGGAGNDILIAGGADTLTGDDANQLAPGFDLFVLNANTRSATITDFDSGFDKVAFEGFGENLFGDDGLLAVGYTKYGEYHYASLDNSDTILWDADTGHFIKLVDVQRVNGEIAKVVGELIVTVNFAPGGRGPIDIVDFNETSAAHSANGFGTLNFVDFSQIATTAHVTGTPAPLSDIDGDHHDDVVFQNAATGQVYYAKMVDGAFQSWGVDTGVLGQDWKAVGVGNVNPNAGGNAEVFVQQQSTGTIYYASHDTGTTTWGAVSTTLSPDWKLRAVGDVNGDGSADAVVQNQSNGTIYYADMHGGAFQGWGVVNANLTADWKAAGLGDINDDGFADVIVQQQSTGTTYFANMANGAFAGWGAVSTNLTADWQVKAVGDVTGDGFADVVFQHASTGTAYYADMKDGAFDHWGVAAQNIDASWKVEGLADVDNDGTQDVLFQHTTDGATLYAHMGPSGFDHWGVVTQNVSSDWQVV